MDRPADRDTIAALRIVARLMGAPVTYVLGGRFYFPVDERWALAISPDDAGRFRVEACHGGRPVSTMWSLGIDRDRLADLVAAFLAEVDALRT
jgi:hypothetical protein